MPENEFEWISTQQAAELVGVDRSTIWRWAKAGLIEAKQMGDWQWFINKADLLDHKAYRDKIAKGRKGEA